MLRVTKLNLIVNVLVMILNKKAIRASAVRVQWVAAGVFTREKKTKRGMMLLFF
jgi:hypothetical protein